MNPWTRANVQLIAGIMSGFILWGCESEATGPAEELEKLPRPLTSLETSVVTGSNTFAFDLLRAVNAGAEGENFFVSPLSVSMALGMTLNGAAGETYNEMQAMLGFGTLSQEEINEAYRGLIDLLLSLDPNVEMAVGNSIWYRDGFPVDSAFLDAVVNAFDAQIEPANFEDPATVDRINGWVRDVTRDRIQELLDRISRDEVMFLINAVYFKGNWRAPFDPQRTVDDDFEGLDGQSTPVRMMNADGTFLHSSGEGYRAIELPYGNGAFAMTIVLPAGDSDVNELIEELNGGRWTEVVNGMSEQRLMLAVPRFELEYDVKLNDPLKSMGMEAAFVDSTADFSRISPAGGLYVTRVEHSSFVKVDEEGTEAAAATNVGIGIVSAPPSFRVDRPFLFAIRERFSGTILFSGKIVSLEEA
ncbi:MAG: serpin family protein [Gemmatimonas sp.]|nr:serpin family protein [Gemmatimonas sp.]